MPPVDRLSSGMRRITYCRTPPSIGNHPPGSAPRKANDRARSRHRERRWSPAVLLPLRLPRPGPRPPRWSGAPPEVFPETNDRPPRASGGDRWMAMREQMSPVWTRSGSRPINHGCSVRDPRPGSSSLNPSPAPKSVRRSVTDAPSGPRCAASRRATNLTVHLAARVWAGSPVNAWSKVDGVRAPGTGPPYPVANALQRRLLGPCTAPICPWALGVSRPTSRGGRRSDAGVAAA